MFNFFSPLLILDRLTKFEFLAENQLLNIIIMIIHRYIKDTIKYQRWEINLIDNEDNSYTISNHHFRTDKDKTIELTEKQITKQEFDNLIIQNSYFHVETYKC